MPWNEYWLSRDPILEAGGLNVYGYVGNSGVDVWGLDPGDWFESGEEAAMDALQYINPTSIDEDMEYAGVVYHDEALDMWSYSQPQALANDGGTAAVTVPGTPTGLYHTHAFGYLGKPYALLSEDFSFGDLDTFDKLFLNGYLGTPMGTFVYYSPRLGSLSVVYGGALSCPD